MKTDDLIDMLGTNVEPVDLRRPWRTLALAVAVGIVLAACLMMLVLGVRPDLLNAGALVSLCLKLLLTGGVVLLAALALNKAMRPGGERKVSLLSAVLPLLAVGVLAVIALAMSPSEHWQSMLIGDQWLDCLISIPLIAAVPFAILTWAVQQAAPTHLSRVGALVGLTAGSISAMGYALHCSDDSVPFVALWYGATIALCTLAGFKLGPRLLRW
jgi:hypothetical protein